MDQGPSFRCWRSEHGLLVLLRIKGPMLGRNTCCRWFRASPSPNNNSWGKESSDAQNTFKKKGDPKRERTRATGPPGRVNMDSVLAH